jgi:hypothetical protein
VTVTGSANSGDHNAVRSFGITFEVHRGSGSAEPVVSERLVPDTLIKLNERERQVELRIDAYGEQPERGVKGVKGNTVTLVIPYEGLLLMAEVFRNSELKRDLKQRLGIKA